MPFFARFRTATGSMSGGTFGSPNASPEPVPYRHIPVHAARDARSQVPPCAREKDRDAIAEHHKRGIQMPEINKPIFTTNNGAVINDWPVGQRDVPYVNKEISPLTCKRPTTILKELSIFDVQRETRASRRAAHMEPTAYVSYHLGLLPSPLYQSMSSSTANGLDPPPIPLPIRTHPPLTELDNHSASESREKSHARQDNAVGICNAASRSNPSCGSTLSITTKPTVSYTSSQGPSHPAPPRNHARDSLSYTIAQDSRFHKPNSNSRRRLRAASHDSTRIEQVMASPESFRPHQAPPVIVGNNSVFPALPMTGFNFGTDRPYSPERLRPWLVNDKNNAIQLTGRA